MDSLTYIKKVFRIVNNIFCYKHLAPGIIGRYLKTKETLKLQIGSGPNILEGWCNTDIFPNDKRVALMDARKPFPFSDNCFNYIFCEHLIEHLEYQEGLRMLGECFRVLKPGGKIRIATPDLKYLVDLYNIEKTDVQRREIARVVDTYFPNTGIYEDSFVINNFFYSFGHKWIYDYKLLKGALAKSGFTDIKRCAVGQSDDCNLRGLECHGKRIGEEFNKLQTMVIEGTKTEQKRND